MENPPPLSLLPGPPPTRGPQTVAEFIQRINAEPGGFRSLNEHDLRRRIEASRHKADEDVDMEDAEEPDESAAKTKEIIAARQELLRNIDIAHRTATTTLDLISLLLSKEMPVQATSTLNPELRNIVGIGTLGATTLDHPTDLAKSRGSDNKLVSIGMRLQAVNKAADVLDAASKRLEEEIQLETTYWNQVRATSERGWSVFRHPDEPQNMAVKFGFSNAAPEFKANSIVPMRRAADGSVVLDHGPMTGVPKRLQVTIEQDGEVVGQSALYAPSPDDVKEARDTVFAQELWHELNREGRTLLSRNVRLRKDAVAYVEDTNRTISFSLVTLPDEAAYQTPWPCDAEADRINYTLHLLLINAHRQDESRRSDHSVAGANKGPSPPHPLLLPLITDREHERTVQRCIAFLGALCRVLRSAGLGASFTMTEPAITGDSTEALAALLMNPPAVEFDLALTASARLRIATRPSLSFGTRFQVYLIGEDDENPLVRTYPPATHPDPARLGGGSGNPGSDLFYDGTHKLFQYLCGAVPRALTWHFKPLLPAFEADARAASEAVPTKWIVDEFSKALADDNDSYGVRFECVLNGEQDDATPELHVASGFIRDGPEPFHSEWVWSVTSSPPGPETSLEATVKRVLLGERP